MRDKDQYNAKKKKVVELESYFFDDLIIEEILLRLPVKSILRFKSVSKQWYSTLSSSNFINAHLMKSPLSHPSAPVDTLFIEYINRYYLFSYDDNQISGNFEDNLVELDVDFGVHENCLTLTGCCNGLICLTPKLGGSYVVIWNPATRKMHKYDSDGGLPCFVVSGFGYASSVDDYKCVRFSSVHSGNQQHDGTASIFSLKDNKWRKIDFVHHDILVFYGQAAVLINEKLYWAAFYEHASCIVSFDLEIERIDIIKLNRCFFLGVMGGCLSKCEYDNETYIRRNKLIHIVEPPAIVKPIAVPKGLRLDGFSQMIGFTRTGKFFMTGRPPNDEVNFYTQALGIVDTSTKHIQYTRLLRFYGYTNIARYVPSLILPFPIEEPSKA